ncbi:hypothetical protein [Amycolatopsis magusensis]|uniref:hypothetical protein n=1 Tax=Amycolatopsis magusensis TaxID=882444 RepID=UPI0024A92DCC|nr:hypothetical protein [Amycolatopsis magusensis]MDI5982160.1 hypothetical protein [Amycolatopsis magusensis]
MTTTDDLPEASVRVVLLRGDTPTAEPTPMCAGSADLLDSSTVLVAPVNVPHAVVYALLRTPVCPEFAKDPWLNQHRKLVFTDGRADIDGHQLLHHPLFGVYYDEES